MHRLLSLSVLLSLLALPMGSSAARRVVPRDAFNRVAVQKGFPLMWAADRDRDGEPDADEIVVLGAPAPRAAFVTDGALTPAFDKAWDSIVEELRRETVRRELDKGRPTVVQTDLAGLSAPEREFVRHIQEASAVIDRLFLRQMGALELTADADALDAESRTLIHRNHGPWCVAPGTGSDPLCSGHPGFPERRWDTYPKDEPQPAEMCEALRELPNAKALMDPFTVVRRRGGELVAVPYNVEYAEPMQAVARELRAAADALKGTDEKALVRYLLAAAQGFETNVWGEADEAWAAMNARNSRWYLRIGPDEVYWDRCQEKAGFHVSFARIDESSLVWQEKLTPLRDAMEQDLADLIGAAYAPRTVRFQMPDFIGIVVNAGNSRAPAGATVGQSLPNWGKVAEEGRGRTVVMTNLYRDPDSLRISRVKAESLLTPDAMKHYSDDPEPGVVDIILHEAMHNLGPHSDFKVDGRDPGEIFGGRLATILEELKAQTGALYFIDMLRQRDVITDEQAAACYTHGIVWAFGHISRGMFTPTGNPKAYSQLAAVQVGFLMERGAMEWRVAEDATTGEQVGRFHLNIDEFPAAVRELMQIVGRVKATGDVAGAKAIIEPYVTGERKALVHMDEVTERVLRFPKATFVYSVEM